MARRLILDSGAIIALARGDRRIGVLFDEARHAGREIAVSSVVVTQTIRGGARDASIHNVHVLAI
ncbi:MAG: hypothetical protein ACREN8_01560 [Candidatus Dormibacteraceae bacterium]